MPDPINISFNTDEALVLFDLLSRWIEKQDARPLHSLVEHDAEVWALNSTLCLLERELGEPFSKDYGHFVDAARASLVDRCGAWPIK